MVIDDISLADMDYLFRLNFSSVFLMSKLSLPHLRRTQGSIINMGSYAGVFGQGKAASYVATKGAVIAFTKALAIDEARNGVRVNSVSPSNILTPLWKARAHVLCMHALTCCRSGRPRSRTRRRRWPWGTAGRSWGARAPYMKQVRVCDVMR